MGWPYPCCQSNPPTTRTCWCCSCPNADCQDCPRTGAGSEFGQRTPTPVPLCSVSPNCPGSIAAVWESETGTPRPLRSFFLTGIAFEAFWDPETRPNYCGCPCPRSVRDGRTCLRWEWNRDCAIQCPRSLTFSLRTFFDSESAWKEWRGYFLGTCLAGLRIGCCPCLAGSNPGFLRLGRPVQGVL